MTIKRIKDLRVDSDLKQCVVANLLNIRQGTYSDYENGKINVPVDALIKLSNFYNVSLDYIVGSTNIKEPYPPE